MAWAADSQHGNALQLEKMGISLCLGKLAKTQIMVDSLFENSLDIFFS